MGTAGLEASAAWLEQRFGELGLEPAGGQGFRHGVDVVVEVALGDGTALALDGKPVAADLFAPSSLSSSGDASGQVVYVDWGISAPELGHDDYKGKNVKGKVVLVRRFTPEGGRFEDKVQRRYSDVRYKAWNAREHGAKAVLIVDLPREAKAPGAFPDGGEAPLPKLSVAPQRDSGIPVLYVKREIGLPRSAKLSVQLKEVRKPVHNIVGRSRRPRTRSSLASSSSARTTITSAWGGTRLWPRARRRCTTARMQRLGDGRAARGRARASARKSELRRDVVLMAFSAEEMGCSARPPSSASRPPGSTSSRSWPC